MAGARRCVKVTTRIVMPGAADGQVHEIGFSSSASDGGTGLDATGPRLAWAEVSDDVLDPAPCPDAVNPVYSD